MYKCKYCDKFETENRFELAGHSKGCKVKLGIIKVEKPEDFTSADVADALLKRIVNIIEEYEVLKEKVKELGPKCKELEKEVGRLKGEVDRLLKIHNEQATRRQLTDVGTLKRLAGAW